MYRDSKHKCKLEIVNALCAMRELASIEYYSYKKKTILPKQNVSIKRAKKFRFLTKNYDFD